MFKSFGQSFLDAEPGKSSFTKTKGSSTTSYDFTRGYSSNVTPRPFTIPTTNVPTVPINTDAIAAAVAAALGAQNTSPLGSSVTSTPQPRPAPTPAPRPAPTPQPIPTPAPRPITKDDPVFEQSVYNRDIGDTASQTIIQSNPLDNIGALQSSEVVQSGVQTQGQVTGTPTTNIGRVQNSFIDDFNRIDIGGGKGGSSSVQFTIYGPYADACAAFAGKNSTRPIAVYIPQDYGDNFLAPRYFGNRELTRAFLGSNKWYWDTNGAAIRIDSNGYNSQKKLEPELFRECEVKGDPSSKKVILKLSFTKGTNHPSGVSVVKGSGGFSFTASTNQGYSKEITLPKLGYGANSLITNILATSGTKSSSTSYRVVQASKWKFSLQKQVTINGQKGRFIEVDSTTIVDKGRGVDPKEVNFTLPFDYTDERINVSPTLTVEPIESFVGVAGGTVTLSVRSSSDISINSPSLVTRVTNTSVGRDGITTTTIKVDVPRQDGIEEYAGQKASFSINIRSRLSGPGFSSIKSIDAIIKQDKVKPKIPKLPYGILFKVNYKGGTSSSRGDLINASGDSTLTGGYLKERTSTKLTVPQEFTGAKTLVKFRGTNGVSQNLSNNEYEIRVLRTRTGTNQLQVLSGNKIVETHDLVIQPPIRAAKTAGTLGLIGNPTIHMTFDYPAIVVDDENPARLRIVANITTTSPWADITVFTLDGDVMYKAPISSFDTDDLKEFRDNNGFKFQIRPRSGWEIQGITQYEPLEKSIDLPREVIVPAESYYAYRFAVRRRVVTTNPEVYPQSTSYEYPINSNANVKINYSTNRDTRYINVKFPFNEINNMPAPYGGIVLKDSFFTKGLGRYTVNLCPYGPNGEKGPEKQVVIDVVRQETITYPDIRKINYPKKIQGADFIGVDVPFQFSYQSVYTDYVKVYLNDKDTRIGGDFAAQDVVKLNVKDLIKYTNKFKKQGDIYTFTFLLVPYGAQSDVILEGKTEKIEIVFDEGDFKLKRDEVIQRICDSVAANLDTNFFDSKTSKYLTHLVHFGDANNEVISNWNADTETFRTYKFDDETKRFTNEKTNNGFDSLVVKMYEPLETTVQPNQQVWITKVQSQPQLHEVILREDNIDYCPPLKGPNFTIDVSSGMGYEIFDDMLAADSGETNATLVNTFVSQSGIDTKKLDIQYVSGDITYNSSSEQYESASLMLAWDKFSHFGSAEERVKNFYYKVTQIENYTNVSASLETGSAKTSLSVVAEKQRQIRKINQVKAGFDGFENFLYVDTGSLAYPKNSDGTLKSTGSADALAWYDETIYSASRYDYGNVNYLSNNIPQYLKDDEENGDFIMFLDMIGHHFDILWTYVESINRNRKLEHKQNSGLSDELVRDMLKSFGYKPNSTLDTAPLWEFALGQYNSSNSALSDGTTQSTQTGKQRQNQIWRRILNNLPYLYKSKGTRRGLQATLSTYGISENLLRIKEFGGPPPNLTAQTKVTSTERINSAMLTMDSNSEIIVPWHTGSGYPQTIEFSIETEEKQDAILLQHDNFYLTVQQDTGSLAKFTFSITGSDSSESTTTATLPFFNDTITSFMIRRTVSSGSINEVFDIFAKESFNERIRAEVSSSVSVAFGESGWGSGSELKFGGFTGSIDTIKLWKSALSESVYNEHVKAPDMYNGNSISSSTDDLFVRLDFEKVENLSISSSYAESGSYRNVAPNTDLYGDTFVTMSNFTTSSSYPYGTFEVKQVERTRTIPAVGFSEASKITSFNPTLKSELSPKGRATKSNKATKGTDSNRIGIFISPIGNVNRDITKALGGSFRIDDFIGDPCEIYADEYTELNNFRRDFFSKYTINYDGFYNLIKYIDKTLFKALSMVNPARVKASTGLLIEPHILERSKARRRKPSGIVFEEKVGVEDISRGSVISIDGSELVVEGEVSESINPSNITSNKKDYETTIDFDFVENLSGSQLSYETTLENDLVNNLSSSYLFYESEISESNKATPVQTDIISANDNEGSIVFHIPSPLTASIGGFYNRDAFETVPPQDTDYSTLGYGITAVNGHASVTFNTPNGRDKERRKYFLITEQVTELFPILNNSGDQSSGYTTTEVTTNIKKLTFTSISGSTPAVTGSVTAVEAVDGNLPSHYIYVKDTSLGLENSFFNGCKQTQATTIDGGPAFETFVTNPNTLKVSDSGRGSGEPILDVE